MFTTETIIDGIRYVLAEDAELVFGVLMFLLVALSIYEFVFSIIGSKEITKKENEIARLESVIADYELQKKIAEAVEKEIQKTEKE